jgi:hypothetical protein
MRTRRLRIVLAILATGAIGAVATGTAEAGTSTFCPVSSTGEYQLVDADGGTCVSAHFSTLTAVTFVAAATGYYHCAVGKADSDGGGANTTNTACTTSSYWATTDCYPPHSSYAKGINREPSRHSYQGGVWWGASCP